MSPKNKKNLGIHFGLILAELICIPAFVFEYHRARSGNELSWAYVFEWPIFAGYAVYMWRKLLRQVREEQASLPRGPEEPESKQDESLAKYNAYLRAVHYHDDHPSS
ncbi:MAG: hypothetical protein ACYCPT_10345 [Acidimicrobiales bacterium]